MFPSLLTGMITTAGNTCQIIIIIITVPCSPSWTSALRDQEAETSQNFHEIMHGGCMVAAEKDHA
jgi:hypothetical protein